jgi:hypothetical protein
VATEVIVKVDAVEQVTFRILVAGVVRQVQPFCFRRAEETLHLRIVPASLWLRGAVQDANLPGPRLSSRRYSRTNRSFADFNSTMCLSPALTIDREQADQILSILDEALAEEGKVF